MAWSWRFLFSRKLPAEPRIESVVSVPVPEPEAKKLRWMYKDRNGKVHEFKHFGRSKGE